MASTAVKSFIRNRDFFKIPSSLETGGEHGMWSFQRYRKWLEARTNWHIPSQAAEPPDSEEIGDTPPAIQVASPKPSKLDRKPEPASPAPAGRKPAVIEIEPIEGEFGKILKRPHE